MLSKRSLLIVEDDPDIRDSLRDIALLDGFQVIPASNGKEALEELGKAKIAPGLILLDLMMPVMDGCRFLEEVAKTSHKNIPVVVVSAAKREQLLNVTEFIEKPANARKILDLIKKYCA